MNWVALTMVLAGTFLLVALWRFPSAVTKIYVRRCGESTTKYETASGCNPIYVRAEQAGPPRTACVTVRNSRHRQREHSR